MNRAECEGNVSVGKRGKQERNEDVYKVNLRRK